MWLSKKPVLVIKEIEQDPSAEFVEIHHKGIAAANNPQSIKQALTRIYGAFVKGKLAEEFDLVPMESISFSYIASKISSNLGICSPT